MLLLFFSFHVSEGEMQIASCSKYMCVCIYIYIYVGNE